MVEPPFLRILFFGTPAFAVPTLEALLASRHPVVAVVTQPDRPRGRGQRTSEAPVKQRALAAGLPVLQPASMKDPAFLEAIHAMQADLGVVAAYGRILTETLLRIPRLGMVNVHASLLPKYRGAAPVHRAVIAGETETGVTIMRMVRALDAGPMLASATLPIGETDTSEGVERQLAALGASLLVSIVDRLGAGTIVETAQDESAATYANRLTKDDGQIDWARPARTIHNLVRGLHPWPHAYTYLDGARLIILRSMPAAGASQQPPGTVVAAEGGELKVAAGEGLLTIIELQAEGKRPMAARDFLAGHRLKPGDRFSARQ